MWQFFNSLVTRNWPPIFRNNSIIIGQRHVYLTEEDWKIIPLVLHILNFKNIHYIPMVKQTRFEKLIPTEQSFG